MFNKADNIREQYLEMAMYPSIFCTGCGVGNVLNYSLRAIDAEHIEASFRVESAPLAAFGPLLPPGRMPPAGRFTLIAEADLPRGLGQRCRSSHSTVNLSGHGGEIHGGCASNVELIGCWRSAVQEMEISHLERTGTLAVHR